MTEAIETGCRTLSHNLGYVPTLTADLRPHKGTDDSILWTAIQLGIFGNAWEACFWAADVGR